MDGCFETGCVKDYDNSLVRRILAYLWPQAHLVFLVFFALAVSTAAELAVPVLEQRLIDKHILARFIALDSEIPAERGRYLSAKTRGELDALKKKDGLLIDGNFFLNEDSRLHLSGAAEKELRSEGILHDEKWFVYRGIPPEDAAKHLFISDGLYTGIRVSDLDTLNSAQRLHIKSGSIHSLTVTVFVLFAALAAAFVAAFLQTYFSSLAGQRIMKDIRLQLYKKTLMQSPAFLARHPVGQIVSRLTSDVETINEFFTSVLTALLKDFSIMIGVLITLFALSPKLAAVAVLCMPPVLVVTIISRIKARAAFRDQRAATSALNSYLSEHLSGIRIVQLFRAEEKSVHEFNKLNFSLLSANLREIYILGLFRPSVEFIAILTTAVVIAVGSIFVLHLSLSIGVLIAFINLLAMFYSPVMDIAEKYTMLQSALAGAERVFMMLDISEEIPDTGRTVPETINGAIQFKDVHFSYEKGEPVLKGLSFTVEAGETAAITGPSGAGKTTVTNLISRLWDIQSGEIFLDNSNIRNFTLDSLRRAALPVLQDVFLFSMTVAENISLGLPLTMQQIEEAARSVHAHEFISRLPDGYNTMLSEGAANISQGERQLISFARVVAHNPPIVILDEATSSVDSETETLIQLGLKHMLSDRTSIVIAHRLSTIRDAGKILVLSGGCLVEKGSHTELIAKGGIYAQLYKLQFEETKNV